MPINVGTRTSFVVEPKTRLLTRRPMALYQRSDTARDHGGNGLTHGKTCEGSFQCCTLGEDFIAVSNWCFQKYRGSRQ